jgi:hypothetical protein
MGHGSHTYSGRQLRDRLWDRMWIGIEILVWIAIVADMALLIAGEAISPSYAPIGGGSLLILVFLAGWIGEKTGHLDLF